MLTHTLLPAACAAEHLELGYAITSRVGGVVNLSQPCIPWLEYAQCALGVLLFISPWMGAYYDHTLDTHHRNAPLALDGDRSAGGWRSGSRLANE